MNQKTILVGLLAFVMLVFGGIIFYDVKVGHKFERVFGKTQPQTNWKWEDQWDGKSPVTPPDKQTPPITDPVGPQVIAGSYAEAIQKSGQMGRPALVFFTADWCTWCKKMKAETLPDQRVQGVMKNYVLVYVDTDKDRAPANKFGVTGLPSYVVTNCKEVKIKFARSRRSEWHIGWIDRQIEASRSFAARALSPPKSKSSPSSSPKSKSSSSPSSLVCWPSYSSSSSSSSSSPKPSPSCAPTTPPTVCGRAIPSGTLPWNASLIPGALDEGVDGVWWLAQRLSVAQGCTHEDRMRPTAAFPSRSKAGQSFAGGALPILLRFNSGSCEGGHARTIRVVE